MDELQNYKMLWVDDHIDKLEPYVVAIQDEGFEVDTASSTQTALDLAGANAYDLILVDINMPHPDGIELLRRLQDMNLPSSPVLGALSSFTYLKRYRERLKQLRHPVELLDKDIPNVQADEFRRIFIHSIRDLAKHGVRFTIQVQEELLKEGPEGNPFQMDLPDFAKLSLLEKDQLLLKAEEMAKRVIDAEFRDGKIWLLLCGDSAQVRASATTTEEILDEDEIMEFARVQNKAPFQFMKAIQVEDLSAGTSAWTPCEGTQYRKDYPTVTLEFDQQPLHVHFDTGSPISFFSYEKLREMEVIPETFGFTRARREGYPKGYMCVWRSVPALLKCQTTGQMTQVTINCQIVRDWTQSPYARFCTNVALCDSNAKRIRDATAGNLCLGRYALIGRSLLIDNQLSLVLDGTNGTTSLLDAPP